jgi:hypothetical protein
MPMLTFSIRLLFALYSRSWWSRRTTVFRLAMVVADGAVFRSPQRVENGCNCGDLLSPKCRWESPFCSVSAVWYPALVRAPLRGFSCALRQLALLLRQGRPAGYGFPPNLVRKVRRKDFSRASVNARASALGSMAHSLQWCPDPDREFKQTETQYVPEQSNPHRLRRQRRRSSRQQPRP